MAKTDPKVLKQLLNKKRHLQNGTISGSSENGTLKMIVAKKKKVEKSKLNSNNLKRKFFYPVLHAVPKNKKPRKQSTGLLKQRKICYPIFKEIFNVAFNEQNTQSTSNTEHGVSNGEHATAVNGMQFAVRDTEKKTENSNELQPKPEELPIALPESKPKELNITALPMFLVSNNKQKVLALLIEPLCFYGALTATLIAGRINIFGYTPAIGEKLEIFSPRGWSHIKIQPEEPQHQIVAEVHAVFAPIEDEFPGMLLEQTLRQFGLQPKSALLLLERNEKRKNVLQTINEYMREQIFPRVSAVSQSTSPLSYRESELALGCFLNVDEALALHVRPEWPIMLEQPFVKQSRNVRIMFIGGKAVGKSTMLRYTINRLLSQRCESVLLLDLDMGQPEVFVPETVSFTLVEQPLLGPACFQKLQPTKAYYTGSKDILHLGPELYVRILQELGNYIAATQPALAKLRWVINTMGYNKGFGDEIIAVICDLFRPTIVVELVDRKPINNFDRGLTPEYVRDIELITIPYYIKFRTPARYKYFAFEASVSADSGQSGKSNLNSKAKRLIMLLAHLSEAVMRCVEGKFTSLSMDNCKVLIPGTELQDEQDKWSTLRNNLVYLCHKEKNTDGIYTCAGLGMTQDVDFYKRRIQVAHSLGFDDDFPHMIDTVACGRGLPCRLMPSRLFIQDPEQQVPHEFTMPDSFLSKGVQQFFTPQGRAKKS